MADLLAELRAASEAIAAMDAAEGAEGDAVHAWHLNPGLEMQAESATAVCKLATDQAADTSIAFLRAHHAELAEALRDASRYKWLRENWGALVTECSPAAGKDCAYRVVELRLASALRPVNAESLDAAIDTATGQAEGATS